MTERTLILLRHAKSDRSGDKDDIARPLAERGRRQAPEAGRWLRANIPGIDLAIVSPAVRARTTWDLVVAALDAPPPVRIDDRVYANSASDLLAVVRDAPEDADTVVLVGHNPGIEELVSRLTSERIEMATSSIAVIALPCTWADAGGGSEVLRSHGRPPIG